MRNAAVFFMVIKVIFSDSCLCFYPIFGKMDKRLFFILKF